MCQSWKMVAEAGRGLMAISVCVCVYVCVCVGPPTISSASRSVIKTLDREEGPVSVSRSFFRSFLGHT